MCGSHKSWREEAKKRIFLGGAQWGLRYGITNLHGMPNRRRVSEFLTKAWYLGFRRLDSAQAYGASEYRIGRFFRQTGKRFQISTKIQTIPGDLRRTVWAKYLESSRILGAAADVMLLHGIGNCGGVREHLKLLRAVSRQESGEGGSAVGVSLYLPSELEYLWDQGVDLDWVQIPLSLADRRFLPYLDELRRRETLVQVRSCFLQGLLLQAPCRLPDGFAPLKPLLSGLVLLGARWNLSPLDLLLHDVLKRETLPVIGVASTAELLDLHDSLNRLSALRDAGLSDVLAGDLEMFLASLEEIPEDILLPYRWKKK